jgi:hypothetical protein
MNNTDKTVIKFRSFFCFLVKYLILIIPEPPLPLPFRIYFVIIKSLGII